MKGTKEGIVLSVPAAAGSRTTAAPAVMIRSGETDAPVAVSSQTPVSAAAVTPAPVPTSTTATASARPVAEPAAQTKAKAIGDPVEQKRLAGNIDRGRKLLDIGNVAMARPILERVAAAGSAEAALLLGASYDPIWLRTKGAIGVEADENKARSWYEIARKGGAAGAEKMLSALAR